MKAFPFKIFLRTLPAIVAFCCFSFMPKSAPGPSKATLQDIIWLLGTWENKTAKGSTFENWIKTTNSRFSGKSYALNGGDTMVFEQLELIEKDDNLFYIPTVKNQNNAQPVAFALKSATDKMVVFENATHDFPQLISYTKINNDSLVAEISGTKNGKSRRAQFPMKRVE